MLLEFRVSNFRSISNEQSINFIASTDNELADTHLALTGLSSLPRAVRSAVVYGPNASGKSTLLSALDYMRAVITESATIVQLGQNYNVQPFKLDQERLNSPTEFELTFLFNGFRHQYAFAMTAQRFISESLSVYHSPKPTQLFSRELNADNETYEYQFSSYLTGSKNIWKQSTRVNALFLSTAAQLNSEALGPIFKWLVESIVYLPAGAAFNHDLTTLMLATEEGRLAVRDFLSSADFGISDVEAIQRKGVHNQMVINDGVVDQTIHERDFMVPVFEHITATGNAKLEFSEESLGTQRWYGFIAPILEVLKQGRILVVDELDSSLHTLLVRRLILMFHNQILNANGAQLIFSTHDTSLLDHTLFRRDQVWFTEKDSNQATQVYPLSDFSPRKREAWEQGYLSGRYGAVPFFAELPDIIKKITSKEK